MSLSLFAGCSSIFKPPAPASAQTETPTPGEQETSASTATATSTESEQTTTRPPFSPGNAVSVVDTELDVRPSDRDSGLAYVDAGITIRNASGRSLSRVTLVIEVYYDEAKAEPQHIVTDDVSEHWSTGLSPGATATLRPNHLYFETDGPSWYSLENSRYELRVRVSVAKPR